MLSNKPRVGIVFSLVAGILMLIVWVGSIGRPIRSIELLECWYWPWWTSSVVTRLCFVTGWAVLILIGASALYIAPKQHSLGGVIILTFSTLTLLLWAGGFILRYLTGYYAYVFFPFFHRDVFRWIELLRFDVLAVSSVFGVIGGASGFLWKTKSAVASVKQSEAKLNLLGVVSAIMAFNSLALPWWVMYMGRGDYILLFPWGEEAAVGTPLPVLWGSLGNYALAMYVALASILISGTLGLWGSLMVGKRGTMLLVVAGTFAVLSVASFAGGLESHLTFGDWRYQKVVPHVFSITPWEDYTWFAYLSFGFWTALVAAILVFIASMRHPSIPSETHPS